MNEYELRQHVRQATREAINEAKADAELAAASPFIFVLFIILAVLVLPGALLHDATRHMRYLTLNGHYDVFAPALWLIDFLHLHRSPNDGALQGLSENAGLTFRTVLVVIGVDIIAFLASIPICAGLCRLRGKRYTTQLASNVGVAITLGLLLYLVVMCGWAISIVTKLPNANLSPYGY